MAYTESTNLDFTRDVLHAAASQTEDFGLRGKRKKSAKDQFIQFRRTS
jgi:hypothetical protein